jgi:hypothetical protein
MGLDHGWKGLPVSALQEEALSAAGCDAVLSKKA